MSFLLALNFFRHSTVSCLCIIDATVDRCWEKEEEKEEERMRRKHRRKVHKKKKENDKMKSVTSLFNV